MTTTEEHRRVTKRKYYIRNRDKLREQEREYRQRTKEKRSQYNRRYRERLKSGEIQLPPLDWAICARGGSAAQARAHYRRGEKPCAACRKAVYLYQKERESRKHKEHEAA